MEYLKTVLAWGVPLTMPLAGSLFLGTLQQSFKKKKKEKKKKGIYTIIIDFHVSTHSKKKKKNKPGQVEMSIYINFRYYKNHWTETLRNESQLIQLHIIIPCLIMP